MLEENTVENTEVEATPVPDVEVSESSTEVEETQLEEQVTSENEPVEKGVPFNEHPRFQELITEKNELRGEIKELRNQMIDTLKPKEADPMAGKSAEEKLFWEQVRKVGREEAESVRKNAAVQIQAVHNEYGKLAANQFLNEHPDVKKGSTELTQIVGKAREIGGNLEDAYKIVMYESNARNEVEKVRKTKQLKNKEKLLANVETKTMPNSAVTPMQDKSFTETFNDAFKDADL